MYQIKTDSRLEIQVGSPASGMIGFDTDCPDCNSGKITIAPADRFGIRQVTWRDGDRRYTVAVIGVLAAARVRKAILAGLDPLTVDRG